MASEGGDELGMSSGQQQLDDQAEAAAMLHRLLGRAASDGVGVGAEEPLVDEGEIEGEIEQATAMLVLFSQTAGAEGANHRQERAQTRQFEERPACGTGVGPAACTHAW